MTELSDWTENIAIDDTKTDWAQQLETGTGDGPVKTEKGQVVSVPKKTKGTVKNTKQTTKKTKRATKQTLKKTPKKKAASHAKTKPQPQTKKRKAPEPEPEPESGDAEADALEQELLAEMDDNEDNKQVDDQADDHDEASNAAEEHDDQEEQEENSDSDDDMDNEIVDITCNIASGRLTSFRSTLKALGDAQGAKQLTQKHKPYLSVYCWDPETEEAYCCLRNRAGYVGPMFSSVDELYNCYNDTISGRYRGAFSIFGINEEADGLDLVKFIEGYDIRLPSELPKDFIAKCKAAVKANRMLKTLIEARASRKNRKDTTRTRKPRSKKTSSKTEGMSKRRKRVTVELMEREILPREIIHLSLGETLSDTTCQIIFDNDTVKHISHSTLEFTSPVRSAVNWAVFQELSASGVTPPVAVTDKTNPEAILEAMHQTWVTNKPKPKKAAADTLPAPMELEEDEGKEEQEEPGQYEEDDDDENIPTVDGDDEEEEQEVAEEQEQLQKAPPSKPNKKATTKKTTTKKTTQKRGAASAVASSVRRKRRR